MARRLSRTTTDLYFEQLRRRRTHAAAVLCAFDLLELDGDDLRRMPLEQRKQELEKLIR
jgi:ATP-dependent DNA ligase